MPRRILSRKCSVAGCVDPYYSKGWCSHHYNANWKHGDPCHAGVKKRKRKNNKIPKGALCEMEGCASKQVATGLCHKHYMRKRNHGDPSTVLRGPKGGGSIKRGYVYKSVGGRAAHKNVLEHRYLMALSLGRDLLSTESVHHKNGVRSDNRLVKGHELHCPSNCCNLELWDRSQPSGQRAVDKLAWAREIIRLYEHLVDV